MNRRGFVARLAAGAAAVVAVLLPAPAQTFGEAPGPPTGDDPWQSACCPACFAQLSAGELLTGECAMCGHRWKPRPLPAARPWRPLGDPERKAAAERANKAMEKAWGDRGPKK
jgi:hypothetical protein